MARARVHVSLSDLADRIRKLEIQRVQLLRHIQQQLGRVSMVGDDPRPNRGSGSSSKPKRRRTSAAARARMRAAAKARWAAAKKTGKTSLG